MMLPNLKFISSKYVPLSPEHKKFSLNSELTKPPTSFCELFIFNNLTIIIIH